MTPNILFFLPDQHRHDWLPFNPALPLRMPNLLHLAERGVRFTNAFCPSPICAPSRACLASGMDYERCRVRNNTSDYPLDLPTYYQSLRDAGYRVAGVGKFDLHKATHDWGLDGSRLLREWGFTEGIDSEGKMDAVVSGAQSPRGPYMAFLHSRGLADMHVADMRARGNRGTDPTPLPEDAYSDNWIAANGIRFLQRFPTGKPWHLVVNFTGPHNPFDVTASMRRAWETNRFPSPAGEDAADHESSQRILQNYAAMLENIDRHLGAFIQIVAERGELDRTLIVYSSDHGELLGDHGRWGKSTYHDASVRIPLIVAGAGVSHGVTSDALVSLQDLSATFLEIAGAAPLMEMDGRSLVRLLAGKTIVHRSHVRAAVNNWRMIFDGRYKLVEQEQTSPLLFDLQADPEEQADLAVQSPEVVNRLSGQPL